MEDKRRAEVERLIIEHVKKGGLLYRISRPIAEKTGVSQPDVESIMRGLFDQHILALDGDGNVHIVPWE